MNKREIYESKYKDRLRALRDEMAKDDIQLVGFVDCAGEHDTCDFAVCGTRTMQEDLSFVFHTCSHLMMNDAHDTEHAKKLDS